MLDNVDKKIELSAESFPLLLLPSFQFPEFYTRFYYCRNEGSILHLRMLVQAEQWYLIHSQEIRRLGTWVQI